MPIYEPTLLWWSNFTHAASTAWADTTHSVSTSYADTTHDVSTAYAETTHDVSTAWADTTHGVSTAWEDVRTETNNFIMDVDKFFGGDYSDGDISKWNNELKKGALITFPHEKVPYRTDVEASIKLFPNTHDEVEYTTWKLSCDTGYTLVPRYRKEWNRKEDAYYKSGNEYLNINNICGLNRNKIPDAKSKIGSAFNSVSGMFENAIKHVGFENHFISAGIKNCCKLHQQCLLGDVLSVPGNSLTGKNCEQAFWECQTSCAFLGGSRRELEKLLKQQNKDISTMGGMLGTCPATEGETGGLEKTAANKPKRKIMKNLIKKGIKNMKQGPGKQLLSRSAKHFLGAPGMISRETLMGPAASLISMATTKNIKVEDLYRCVPKDSGRDGYGLIDKGYCEDGYDSSKDSGYYSGKYSTDVEGCFQQCLKSEFNFFIHHTSNCYCGHSKEKTKCSSWTTDTSYSSYRINRVTDYAANDNMICHYNYSTKESIGSFEDCKQHCGDNCPGFSYHPDWKQCRLAKNTDGCSPGDYSGSTYYAKRKPTEEYVARGGICHYNYSTNENIGSFEECKQYCGENCPGFSYHPGWKQCRIAKNTNGCRPGEYPGSTYYAKQR